MKLLPSQLNQLYDIIVNSNYFSPSQFAKSSIGDEFKMTGTEFYFRIFEDQDYVNSLYINYSPGEILYKDGSARMGWEEVKLYFNRWLTYLKREITSPDKWGRLFEEMTHLVGAPSTQADNFTHVEYLDVAGKIGQIQSSLSQIPLLSVQTKAISDKLDNLLELTTKLNKFDWQNLFIGTIISIVIQLNVTPENASLLYELIKKVFKGLILQ